MAQPRTRRALTASKRTVNWLKRNCRCCRRRSSRTSCSTRSLRCKVSISRMAAGAADPRSFEYLRRRAAADARSRLDAAQGVCPVPSLPARPAGSHGRSVESRDRPAVGAREPESSTDDAADPYRERDQARHRAAPAWRHDANRGAPRPRICRFRCQTTGPAFATPPVPASAWPTPAPAWPVSTEGTPASVAANSGAGVTATLRFLLDDGAPGCRWVRTTRRPRRC